VWTGNFSAIEAFAEGVETTESRMVTVSLSRPVHTPNAGGMPLLREVGDIAGQKIENSRKKMAGDGNHTEQQPQKAAEPSSPVEAEAAFLRRLRGGDQAAYHELVDRFGQLLYRVAYSMVGNSADAEDAVAETFSAAFAGIGKFRGEASLKTWLMQILVRQCAKLKRTRGRKWMIGIEKVEQQNIAVDSASAVESRMDVVAMLQTLSDEHREVIVLRELQSMSYEEMSETLKIPRGTVESRLHRARTELRAKFGEKFGS
jgi:RNA polymerase sigma-70 factor (ECF subfamily)